MDKVIREDDKGNGEVGKDEIYMKLSSDDLKKIFATFSVCVLVATIIVLTIFLVDKPRNDWITELHFKCYDVCIDEGFSRYDVGVRMGGHRLNFYDKDHVLCICTDYGSYDAEKKEVFLEFINESTKKFLE